jgi:hypothetical protein
MAELALFILMHFNRNMAFSFDNLWGPLQGHSDRLSQMFCLEFIKLRPEEEVVRSCDDN